MTYKNFKKVFDENIDFQINILSHGYKDINVWIIYNLLKEDEYYARSLTVKIFDLAPSTVSSYCFNARLYYNPIRQQKISEFTQENYLYIKMCQDLDKQSQIKEYAGYAYLAKLHTTDGTILKVGYAENVDRRLKEIVNTYYSKMNVLSTTLIKTWGFDEKAYGYIMESVLHRYFYNLDPNKFIPHDRFAIEEVTEEDLQILDEKYQFILENADNL